MIDEDTIVFRFEDQFDEFLDYMEIPKPPKDNVTKYREDYNKETLEMIYDKEKDIYNKWYNKIVQA